MKKMTQTTQIADEELLTIDSYDELVDTGILVNGFERYHPASYWQTEMETFHKLLPSGRVLEVGSGGGQHAQMLIKMGYDYVGTDASAKMVEVARQRLPGVLFYQQAAEALDLPAQAKLDGFWAAAVLLHISKANIDQALQRLHSVTSPRAVGFISLIDGQGEGLVKELFEGQKYQRFFAYWSRPEFENTLVKNNFKVVDYASRPKNKSQTWHCFFVETK